MTSDVMTRLSDVMISCVIVSDGVFIDVMVNDVMDSDVVVSDGHIIG